MKTKKRITRAIIVMTVIIAGVGCRQSMTEKALAYGDNLRDAMSDYEQSRQQFSDELNKSYSDANENISDKKTEVGDMALDWEKRWDKVHENFQQLEEDFSRVGKSSGKYFEKLKEITSGIQNESLRRKEELKNKRLKTQWTKAYEKAAQKFVEIRQILREGNDYQRVLVASSVRQKLEKNIEELELISMKAGKVIDELKEFTIEGKKLIG